MHQSLSAAHLPLPFRTFRTDLAQSQALQVWCRLVVSVFWSWPACKFRFCTVAMFGGSRPLLRDQSRQFRSFAPCIMRSSRNNNLVFFICMIFMSSWNILKVTFYFRTLKHKEKYLFDIFISILFIDHQS